MLFFSNVIVIFVSPKYCVMEMKKIVLFVCALCCTMLLHAQEVKMDKELAALVDVVKILRNPSESNFNKAFKLLKADDKWTPMNETGKLQATECKASENIPTFKLNRILTSVMKEQKRVSTPGTMLNGEDSRYNYSLYERCLKKGTSATYKLKKRYGKQTFVLVPYANKKGSLRVFVDGKKPITVEQEDGTLICSFDSSGKEISFTVANKSGTALSFVLLNNNSRKK